MSMPGGSERGTAAWRGSDRVTCILDKRRAAILLVASALFLAGIAKPGPVLAGGVDFIVPGVSLESVRFDAGTEVSYLILTRVYETCDTTTVRLAVLEGGGDDIVLEIASSPYPATEEETVTIRLELARDFPGISDPEEIMDYIGRILVKDGAEPFREPTAEEIDEFDLERILLRSGRKPEAPDIRADTMITEAGVFACDVIEYGRGDTTTVNLGGIDARREKRTRTVLWFSGEVPFWGLVGSRVEEWTVTRLDSPVSTAPREKMTVTESVLLSYRNFQGE